MKQIILIGIAAFSCGGLHGQKLKESEVPTAVKDAFSKSFPNAKKVAWSKETDTEFEAEFKNGQASSEEDKRTIDAEHFIDDIPEHLAAV